MPPAGGRVPARARRQHPVLERAAQPADAPAELPQPARHVPPGAQARHQAQHVQPLRQRALPGQLGHAARPVTLVEQDVVLGVASGLPEDAAQRVAIADVDQRLRAEVQLRPAELDAPAIVGVLELHQAFVEPAHGQVDRALHPQAAPAGVRQVGRLVVDLQPVALRDAVDGLDPGRVEPVGGVAAGDEIVPGQPRAHRGQPALADLVVGVAEGQGLAGGGQRADVAGVRGPALIRGVHHPQVRQPAAISLDDGPRVVGGAIVRDDDLPRLRPLLAGEGLELRGDIRRGVVARDDNAEFHRLPSG